jgi:hypothetical protein
MDYTIRTNHCDTNGKHLKLWLVETSADETNCREVDHKEDNKELNGQ